MAEILALTLLVVFNMQLARKKHLSPGLWAFLTVLGFVVIGGIATAIYFMATYPGKLVELSNNQEALRNYAMTVQTNPVKQITGLVLCIGGALLIRFILEKSPAGRDNSSNRK